MADPEFPVRVDLGERSFEVHADGTVYHRLRRPSRRGQRVQLVRVHHPGVVSAVLDQHEKDVQARRAAQHRARELASADDDPDPKEDGTGPGPLLRTLGYPIRWLRAFWRAREIDPSAGPVAWARRATRWAPTD